ncbi:peptidylprolyl isomerase [Sphingomonas sp. Leaf339]|uniref:peptidylprolyl isomerase n=1 Tax=Sphingomonas sp. Leaf339 TaxID=1736343 RepID=UPI0006FA93AF|nr:peptidylprolyl isomerase [Sphingomonas sp. Leaf339]KQU62577.1 peptidylprolyl isomerase [Sphingomonas sp. Leaf339]
MNHRFVLLAPALLTIAAAPQVAPVPAVTPVPLATPVPLPAPSPAPKPYATVGVTIVTSEGPIVLELERERAPITTANFLRYVDGKRFDGTTFYRAMKLGQAGLIQGGVRNATKLIYPPIAHEPTTRTGLTHDDGAISLGRAAPGSGRGDFFIMVGSVPTLDANPAATGDKLGYAVFGHVTSGMEIVRHILGEPTSPTAGPPAMKGQMLIAPIRILTARRVVAKRS